MFTSLSAFCTSKCENFNAIFHCWAAFYSFLGCLLTNFWLISCYAGYNPVFMLLQNKTVKAIIVFNYFLVISDQSLEVIIVLCILWEKWHI